ncbi:hypothetical protein CcrSwift_gp197 [Caulobacter phage CcrSwift]|uniref:Uncharacterized protein n=1 Tax=Caulobacter phage CcrSwift TaxID=2927984 RepID=K4JVT0_9CAUD|nr:hypothetical protein CcrMagneto_gp198 [Caulobacter virus Magneto]YP_006989930.1 hypothetical protein D870_gp224 [Caulobacter phage CcrSwift]AFU87368.1 hypothetical protein CcrMagneto_gp198 [Caulobacter virus Magneto]AFU88515.1 hypothetical protein CcrSwift_gp197 [Caulobacter phage CcrSwift]ARB14414.1 hypothetical protein Ccr5_gp194c [Caulobacter phage Ccr5]
MQRPDIWIERDHAGLRLTLYDKRLQYGIRATARHQPYMSEQQWIDAQLDLLALADGDVPIHEDRFLGGALLGDVAAWRAAVSAGRVPA